MVWKQGILRAFKGFQGTLSCFKGFDVLLMHKINALMTTPTIVPIKRWAPDITSESTPPNKYYIPEGMYHPQNYKNVMG